MSKFVGCVAALAIAIAAPLAAAPKNPVKITSAKAVQGTQQVVIGQVTIGFLIERKDSAKAGGYGGRSTVRSTLNGYTQADLQTIADAAHSDLEAKLKQAGFVVTDRGALVAHPQFAKSKPQAAPYEMSVITGRDDKAKVLFVASSQSAPLRLAAGDAVVGGFSAMGMIMNGTQVTLGASDYARTTGIRVVNAVYYVDFADSEEYGGWFRSSSAVKVNGSLALLPDQSKLTLIGPNNKSATLALADPVAVGGDFFEAANTTSGGEKASQAVANVIGILGGVGTNSSKRMTFTARAGTYVPGASQATADANSLLVTQLAALR